MASYRRARIHVGCVLEIFILGVAGGYPGGPWLVGVWILVCWAEQLDLASR